VVSPTVSCASFDTTVSIAAGKFSFEPLACSSGFGFDWKKPFRLFWPLAGAAFVVELGAGFCFFDDWVVEVSDALRFLSGDGETATLVEEEMALSPRAEGALVECIDLDVDAEPVRLFDEETVVAGAAGAVGFLNMSLMLLLW
jgi:hypothetical protein